MHDGVLRVAGLTGVERKLFEGLEQDKELCSDAELVEALLRVVAKECRLPAVLLPKNLPDDLFPRQALAERMGRESLSPFARDVWRGIETSDWDRQTYVHAFEDAVSTALDAFLHSERGKLETLCKPQRLGVAALLVDRYDAAENAIRNDFGDLIAQFGEYGRVQVNRPTPLDLDGHIPGAESYGH